MIVRFKKILQVNLFPAGYSPIEPLCGGAGVCAAGLRQSAPTPLYAALQKPVLTEDSQVSGEETVLESTPVSCFGEFLCKVIYIN